MTEHEFHHEELAFPTEREQLLHEMRASEIWDIPHTMPDKNKPEPRVLSTSELQQILEEIQKGLGKYNAWLEWGKGEKIVAQVLFGSINNGMIREDEQGKVISDADVLTIVKGKKGGEYPRPGGMGGEGSWLQFTKAVGELNMEIISLDALENFLTDLEELTQEFYLEDYLDQVYKDRPKHIYTLKNRWHHLHSNILHLRILTFGTTLSQADVPLSLVQKAWVGTKQLEAYKQALEWQEQHPGQIWGK